MRGDAQFFAEQIGEFRRMVAGVARRMSVRLTSGGLWQLAGHLLLNGVKEAPLVELWPGIGFFARPQAGSSSAEAIVVNVGGSNNPAIVATRDEATRRKVDDVVADEAIVYNSVARVHVKADGSIEIRTHAGVAAALISLNEFLNHTHASFGGPPVEIVASVPPGFDGTKTKVE